MSGLCPYCGNTWSYCLGVCDYASTKDRQKAGDIDAQPHDTHAEDVVKVNYPVGSQVYWWGGWVAGYDELWRKHIAAWSGRKVDDG